MVEQGKGWRVLPSLQSGSPTANRVLDQNEDNSKVKPSSAQSNAQDDFRRDSLGGERHREQHAAVVCADSWCSHCHDWSEFVSLEESVKHE